MRADGQVPRVRVRVTGDDTGDTHRGRCPVLSGPVLKARVE